MASLTICEEADHELDSLYDEREDDAALIDVLLQELSADEGALESLWRDTPKWEWRFKPPYEVKRFGECWKRGKRIYILKVYDLEGHLCDYRVIVGHDPATDDYVVLATPHRDFNYEPTSPEFADILARYDRSGLTSSK
ncbi:hypothetical protein [Variovorax sp. OV084]|uniref:hypothetical protein n=1 Tax=Variovorax sp. OV084 TaxID=1882777 RepID=UPI0015A5148D|nr:hypothetical protein [Variovorax sp. OV084]